MLELFSMDTCQFCKKVKEFLHQRNIEYVEHDVNEQQWAYELIKLGGKPQVPFLVDRDKRVFLYNSDSIIKYIQEHE